MNRSSKELLELCLRLSKFKKENKELLTYLLYESSNEEQYIKNVKTEVDEQFAAMNRKSYYFITKNIRKILRDVKKYIRYSKKKETEVELLLYFCHKMKKMTPSMRNSFALRKIYAKQVEMIERKITNLHEDLQYDYRNELDEMDGKVN